MKTRFPIARVVFASVLLLGSASVAAAADVDMDGHETPFDCNDNNPTIHPGAVEIPADSTDQDCDGHERCWTDNDDDGARLTTTVESTDLDCNDIREGLTSDPIDCDDTNAAIHPTASEVCDAGNTDEDCDGVADDDDSGATGETAWFSDDDEDTYGGAFAGSFCDGPAGSVSSSGDCDDTDAAIHPGAAEICDAGNTDEDCDGLADDEDSFADGKSSWYGDDDGDGFGAGSDVLACDAPVGTVADSSDCDDTDSSVNPDATEVCDADNKDDDCDGGADDNDIDAIGKTSWYADDDADGFGAGMPVLACDAPVGTVAETGDCDDSDSSVNPGAAEVCDSIDRDEDCDTVADDADDDATGKSSWYADADDDGYGDASNAVTSCDQPTGTVSSSGDCDDADSSVHPAAVEVCGDTKDNDCDDLDDCDDADCSAESTCGVTVQVFDHLECFKIKAGDKMKGTVNVDPGAHPSFAAATGCTVLKASKYCVPVAKTVTLFEGTTTQDASHVGQELMDDRICYKMKCPAAEIGTISAHDQFGTHSFEKFKVSEICTPAVVVP
jgi:hypothetical protein